MNILSFHMGHNSSAALMTDGRIVGAIQEERFSKRKNQVAFPLAAMCHLLDTHLGGDSGRLDLVSLATTDVDPIGLAVGRYSSFSVADHVLENHKYWHPVFYESAPADGKYWRDMFRRGELLNGDHNLDLSYMTRDCSLEDLVRFVSDELRVRSTREALQYDGAFSTEDHHACHAYYAFYGAQIPRAHWDRVLILTADSWGDGLNWSASRPTPSGRIERIAAGSDNHVARIYRNTTLLLGMKPNEHEYKVMGLSGYSRPSRYVDAAEAVFLEALDFKDGTFLRGSPLLDSYFDLQRRLEGHRFDNISAGLQAWCTRVTTAWARHWLQATGCDILCFSGGLSMNIKTNASLLELPELTMLHVPASGGDETLPLGACYKAYVERTEAPPLALEHAYLGDVIGRSGVQDDWRSGVARAGARVEDFLEIKEVDADDLAGLLANDEVLARCVGPMEFGARALGNRSILANPSNIANLKWINDAIKSRDFWMPFTPSILAERVSDLLHNPKGCVSPYMTIGFESRADARAMLAAALHPGDFSARPQFVDRRTNPLYADLIMAFERKTGIPALLNTSLNLHGDPMNSTIADAARTVALSGLELLALPDDHLLVKRAAAPRILATLGRG